MTAAVLVVVGLVAAGAFGISSLLAMRDHLDDLPNVDMPGAMNVSIDAGGQVLYYEGNGTPALGDLHVTITGPDGQGVPVKRYAADLQNDLSGDRVIKALGTFHAERSGTYRIATDGPAELGAVAVGGSFAPRTVAIVVGSILIALVTAALGLVIAARTYLASR